MSSKIECTVCGVEGTREAIWNARINHKITHDLCDPCLNMILSKSGYIVETIDYDFSVEPFRIIYTELKK